jgi:putative flavoprotein involved in K+ transport
MSAVLEQRGRDHVEVERPRGPRRWRTERWESLRCQFPNWSLELPHNKYAGRDANGFAPWRDLHHIIEE